MTTISPLTTLLSLLGITAVVALNAVIVVWMERKVAGHMQFRLGPMEVGPHGLMQTLADGIKLVAKQIIIPHHADTPLFLLAPVVCLVPVFVALMPVPFSETMQVHDLEIGLLLVVALGLLNTVGILLAGWGSDNKYALLGAARAIALTAEATGVSLADELRRGLAPARSWITDETGEEIFDQILAAHADSLSKAGEKTEE